MMADENKPREDSVSAPQTAAAAENQPPADHKSAKERLYDKIPLTVKQLDVIIVICIAVIIFAFVFGALKGNGIL